MDTYTLHLIVPRNIFSRIVHYSTSCCLMHWLLALFATGGDVPPAFLHHFITSLSLVVVSWAPGGLEPLRCQPFCRRNARASCACTCSRAGSRCPPMGRVPMWILFLFINYSVFFFKVLNQMTEISKYWITLSKTKLPCGSWSLTYFIPFQVGIFVPTCDEENFGCFSMLESFMSRDHQSCFHHTSHI